MISICSIWLNSSIPSFSFHSPAAVALLRWFGLQALVAKPVATQADCFYGLVDAKRVGEGLQSWHEAKASGQQTRGRLSAAVLNYLHCQLVRMSRVSLVPTHVRSSRHHPAHSILHVCIMICFHHFSTVYPKVTHCNSFSTKIRSETTYPVQKEDKVPERAVNLETVET